ncbi:MAB_1171c family putative transporter [Micromonospora tulbaghiae]
MTGPVGVAALALLWAAVIYRSWRLPRGAQSPQRTALWLAIMALAMAATVFYPTVYRALDRAVGVPNLAELVGHSLILLAAWQAHSILIFLIYPRSAARRRTWAHGALVVVSVAAMAIFFGLAPVDQEAPQTFTTVYAEAPYIVPYWVTFLVAANYLLGDMVRLVARYAARSPHEHLRLGLHLIAVGGSFGVAYWCYWVSYLVARNSGLSVSADIRTAGRSCMFAAIVFCVLGSTVPALGPRVGLPTPYAWRAGMRDYRQLYPLWRALATAAPEIVLNRPPLFVVDVRFWLNRRIIEIEDGLRLHGRNAPHAGRPGPQSSHQPDGDRDPAAEAELIRQAVRVGRQQVETPRAPAGECARETTLSYTDRLRWHLEVARAYANLGGGGRRPMPAPATRRLATGIAARQRKEVDDAT